MATLAQSDASLEHRERSFFLIMACVMSAIIVAGFGMNAALGRSSFAAPLLVHIHAFVFFGWVALYLAQTALVATGNVALHRRLGWLAAIWLPAMLVLGIAMTFYSLRAYGGPPFFDVNQFLFSNLIQLFGFGGLVTWAIIRRRDTAWHRRAMFCAMAILTGPGLGRLLPMPFLIPYAWWVSIFLPLIFPLIGMWTDQRRHGRIHPAWLWGIGLVVVLQIIADLIAYSTFGYSITEQVIAGTPGAERPLEAFFPS